MLAKAPEDRYPSIDPLMADLEAAACGTPIPVVEDGAVSTLLDSDPASETSPSSDTKGWRIAAVVLVAVLAAVVFVANHLKQAPPAVVRIEPAHRGGPHRAHAGPRTKRPTTSRSAEGR